MRREQIVTTWLMSGLKQHGWFLKIPDAPFQQRFNIPRPFDIVGVYQGVPVAIEVKAAGEMKALSVSSFREHQPEALRAFSEAGGRSLVAYICYKPREYNRLYWFDFVECNVGRETISKKALQTLDFSVCSNKKYSTDLFLKLMENNKYV